MNKWSVEDGIIFAQTIKLKRKFRNRRFYIQYKLIINPYLKYFFERYEENE